jgi:glyoxylase-like metal-dependent hydrolase (beta-lactamase superfamily II)
MKEIQIGEANVSIFDNGALAIRLANIMHTRSHWDHTYDEFVNTVRLFPSLTIHISLPERVSVIVDPNDYSLSSPPGSEFHPENYLPPAGIFDQIQGSGIQLSDITYVVITHAHFDHYAGVTRKNHEEKFEPAFPNAKYFLGRADWERRETQDSLKIPASEASNSLGVLKEKGVLNLSSGVMELAPEVTIEPAPGETPGHQIVKLHSRSEALYCTGDLFHDFVEVENPSAMSAWSDFESNLQSKESVTKSALEERAYVVPAHMQLGRIRKVDSKIKWESV